jgi:hypothetical protein
LFSTRIKHSDKSDWILAMTDIRNIFTVIGSENWANDSSKYGLILKHFFDVILIRKLIKQRKNTQLLVM